MSNKKRIQGCSILEIKQIQKKLNCRLPEAFSTFLQIMGKGSGGLIDNINIYSLEEAKEVANEIISQANRKLDNTDYPLLHHGGNRFYFIRYDKTDESIVFVYKHYSFQQVSPNITSWIRELAIGSVEIELWIKENNKGIKLNQNDWIQYENIRNEYDEEIISLRDNLIKEYAFSDWYNNNRITGPIEFQKHWCKLLKQTKQYKELKAEGKRLPWDWIDPSIIK